MLKAFQDAAWDHVVVPVVLALLNTVWPHIHTFLYAFILTPIVLPLFIIDILESAVDIFAGIVPIATGDGTMTIFDYFMGQSFVTRAFWGITVISAALCIGFSIVAVIRSMGDLDVQRPVGKVIRSVGNAMLTFLLVPFLCITAISLSGMILRQTSLLITATGAGATSGEQISTTGALFMAGITEDAIPSRLAPQWAYASKTREFYRDEDMDYDKRSATLDKKLVNVSTDERMVNYTYLSSKDRDYRLSFLNAQQAANPNITFRTAEYNYLRDKYLYMRTSRGSTYVPDAAGGFTTEEDIEKAMQILGGKALRWLVSDDILKDFDMYSIFFSSIVTCIISWFYAVMMVMILLMFLRRIFELILLYIAAPFFVSVIPLDEGEKFKAWRERFISTLVAGFGSVFMLKILTMLMPVIWSDNFMLSSLPPINVILKAILMAGGIFATYKSHTMISSIISERGAASEKEAANLGAHYMINQPMMMAQMGVQMGMQKLGQGVSFLTHKASGAFSGGGGGSFGGGSGSGGDGHSNPHLSGPNISNEANITNVNNMVSKKLKPPDKPLPPTPDKKHTPPDKPLPSTPVPDIPLPPTPAQEPGITIGAHRETSGSAAFPTPQIPDGRPLPQIPNTPPDIPLPPTPMNPSPFASPPPPVDRPLPTPPSAPTGNRQDFK